jgi:hypothetical protein
MSFLTNIEALWQKDEAWVVQLFGKLEQDATIAEADLMIAMAWMSAHGSQITTVVGGLVGAAASLGLGMPVPVTAALNGLNVAVALVNQAASAAVAAKTAGASDPAALVAAGKAGAQAYQSLKSSQVLVSQAQASVATGAK